MTIFCLGIRHSLINHRLNTCETHMKQENDTL